MSILRKIYFTKFRYSKLFNKLREIFGLSYREKVLNTLFDFIKVNKVYGGYLEFGVYQGTNLAHAYNISKAKKLNMKFYAFDSFEGLPEIKKKDKEGHFKKSMFYCNLNDFKKIIKNKNVDLNELTIVKGWFNKSLTPEIKIEKKIKKAAIVWIDCDLYESTVPCLEFITDIVDDGTIIAFDDWYCFKGREDKGEKKAFLEWLNKNKHFSATPYHKFGWNGQTFIINKNN